MGTRRKNLLEAFQNADRGNVRGQTPAPEPVRASSAPVPSGSSAGSPGASSLEAMAASRSRSGVRPPMWLLVVAGLGLVFALGYVLGHGSKGGTRAEERAPRTQRPALESQPRAFQGKPSSAAPAPVAPGSSEARASDGTPRIEDSALYDPRNAYTVVVASYSRSKEDFARATYDHLVDEKLAVFPPVVSKNLVLVLIGAAPTAAELEKIESTVKALQRDGKKPYFDAYIARIDALIPRTNTKGNRSP